MDGLIAGAIYSLTASGMSLVYATNRFWHLAHGAVLLSAAYALYGLYSLLGLNFYLSSILTVITAMVLGLAMYIFLYRPLRRRRAGNLIMLIASAGVLLFFEGFAQILFGSDVKTLEFIEVQAGINVGGVLVTPLQLIIIACSVVLLLVFWIFIKLSPTGKKLRAVADNVELARLTGINTDRFQALSFVIASAIAGCAAILIALERNVEPRMGVNFALVSFTSSVVGGIGSMPGSILGSYLIGFAENVTLWVIPSGYKEAIPFVVLFLFLVFRQNGILGVEKGMRE